MEMIKALDQALAKAEMLEPVTVAVAAAEDIEVLEAVRDAKKRNIAQFRLFGDQQHIESLSEKVGLELTSDEVIHTKSHLEACAKAVEAVRIDRADVVMKGMVHSSDFLRAVLNKEKGLRTGKVLSHVAVFEAPGYDRLIHITDPALNVAPTLQEKKQILENVIEFCHSLGNENPKIACLAAVEVVNPNMPPTVEAAVLTQMNRRGQIKGAVIDGPFGLDNAVSIRAAKHKKIDSEVAGRADVLLVPDIEAGNLLYKSLVYFGGSHLGGLVLGARNPVILTSRADTHESKLYSIALAVIQASYQKNV
ncbi:phosphate butyryltransferase [Thermoflavimicrobium dichotomicum]|uniref:Phosphate butyryltransferase n=1 Tax=Thermoflavimicrobium dichotomicum TaxID=46223 RepID=A0A1I3Q7Y2_9BACL|nr:phosphate butyryltransferase [Thermoflavimicrobium dichotomicum]SFJ29765.1 phosphate butyryltransferase [Thermoflavimicrobium dichotomicum]